MKILFWVGPVRMLKKIAADSSDAAVRVSDPARRDTPKLYCCILVLLFHLPREEQGYTVHELSSFIVI